LNTTDHTVDAEDTFANSRRARPTRVPSALPKAQIALVKHEVVERFGA
jgi:hypothetical protein